MAQYFFWLVFVFLVLFPGCDGNSHSTNSSHKKLSVVATTGMIADAVHQIGGDLVDVEALMGPGVDPHLYKATASDTSRLLHADVIFYNGLHLEGKLSDTLEKLKRQKKVYAISEDISPALFRKLSEDIYDPHIWFDVSLWIEACRKVEKVLVQCDDKNATAYQEKGAAYRQELQNLHEWTKREIATIDPVKRVLITAHDAFGYFSRAYNIEVVGLQGISTAAEYGIKDIEKIIHLLVQRQIHAVFVESSVSHKALESVLYGCKAQNHSVKIGGSLFSDAMGDANTPEGTYVGMVRYNVKTIVEGLKK